MVNITKKISMIIYVLKDKEQSPDLGSETSPV